jgi:hypothetical protein
MAVSLTRYRYIVYVLVVAFLIVFISAYATRNARRYTPATKLAINDIVDSAARQVVTSSEIEASNPLLAYGNACYARGKVEALQMIAPREDLLDLAHVRFEDLEREAKRQEWAASQKLFLLYPSLVPRNALSNIAGLYPEDEGTRAASP